MEFDELPSVDDVAPSEEGGPIARSGFNYQDEIGVSFLIDMLEDASVLKIHFETHDDIVFVRAVDSRIVAEFVQVKAGEINKLWSAADLCHRDQGVGSSILEISLGRDAHREESRFRLVTLRSVNKDLKSLTFPLGSPGRQAKDPGVIALLAELKRRIPDYLSKKRNGFDYWLERCFWEVCHDEEVVRAKNANRLMRLSARDGPRLLVEQVDQLLEELRLWVKDAGAARWRSHREKKIVTQTQIRAWWGHRTRELIAGATSASGRKLARKMEEAGLSEEQIQMAVDLRLDYARTVRTSRYMDTAQSERLQGQAKSALTSLRARLIARQLEVDGLTCYQGLNYLLLKFGAPF